MMSSWCVLCKSLLLLASVAPPVQSRLPRQEQAASAFIQRFHLLFVRAGLQWQLFLKYIFVRIDHTVGFVHPHCFDRYNKPRREVFCLRRHIWRVHLARPSQTFIA